jgi:hypothetical protein
VFWARRDELGRFEVSVVAPDGEAEVCARNRMVDDVLALIFWEVNRRALRSMEAATVIHAGVVAGPVGALALCADTLGGRSTLCAAAARVGWTYLSDDIGAVDTVTMHVAPFARPVALREGGLRLLDGAPVVPDEERGYLAGQWFIPASALGARVADAPLPLVAAVFLVRGGVVTLEPVSPARTLHGLVQQSARVRERGASELAALERIARSVPGYRLTLGPPAAALGVLASLVGPAVGH